MLKYSESPLSAAILRTFSKGGGAVRAFFGGASLDIFRGGPVKKSPCICHQQLMPRWKLESTDAVTSSISSRVITPSPFKSYKWNVHLKKRVYMRKKLSVFLGVLYCGVQRITKRKLTYLVTWECFMNFDTLRLFHCALVQFNFLDFTLFEFYNLGNLGGNPAETSLHIR